LADIDFVLADQFQELGMAKPVSDRFLQPHVQGLQQTREAELFQGVFKIAHIQVLGCALKQSGVSASYASNDRIQG